jgi:hypothetical protein
MNAVRSGCNRLFVLPLLRVAGNALGGGINLSVTHDGTVDIFVTIYDMSATPQGNCRKASMDLPPFRSR